MTHSELARRVARRESVSIRDARRILDAAALEIAIALAAGEPATIAGVGTFARRADASGRTRFRSSTTTRAAAPPGLSAAIPTPTIVGVDDVTPGSSCGAQPRC
ncbi:HU family DNA-binding protein [Sphingosinicellaceae bacterium]|nr:HU family DNA-binding protein [Sphingosinicellaceae bacterium]